MSVYDLLKNVYGENNEEQLTKSLLSVKEKLNDLDKERMCKVYSSFLSAELSNNHVPHRIINTLDLDAGYEHHFILVPTNTEGYFLADMTFSQFQPKEKELPKLLEFGYQLIENDTFNKYLNIVTSDSVIGEFDIDDVFYSSPKSDTVNSSLKR